MFHKLRKTLLIVCEGTVTEPQYFRDLVNSASSDLKDYHISISPIPPKGDHEEDQEQTELPAERPTRKIKSVTEEPLNDFIPEEYKSQPREYVWKARKGLEIHDETWAVFDKDDHPSIEEAFADAEIEVNSKFVNIAFSSRSFEFWFLLHFQFHINSFDKTLCRTRTYIKKGKKKDEYHECGERKGNPHDCQGSKCITGYIKHNGFIKADDKIKKLRFKGDFQTKVFDAIIHAQKLRRHFGALDRKKLAVQNPYTDVDRLVFKLLFIKWDYKWLNEKLLSSMEIQYEFQIASKILSLKITNKSKNTYLFDPSKYSLINVRNEHIDFSGPKETIRTNENFTYNISLEIANGFIPSYLRLPLEEGNHGLIELTCL